MTGIADVVQAIAPGHSVDQMLGSSWACVEVHNQQHRYNIIRHNSLTMTPNPRILPLPLKAREICLTEV
jgi:hypothetical protein